VRACDALVALALSDMLEGENLMVCSICGRRTAECDCKKPAVLNGKWPTKTWMQERLKKIRMEKIAQKESHREAGASRWDTIAFIAVFCVVVGAIWVHAEVLKQLFHWFDSIGGCIKALLECRNI
jgi:hypothetical protein